MNYKIWEVYDVTPKAFKYSVELSLENIEFYDITDTITRVLHLTEYVSYFVTCEKDLFSV